MHHLWHAHPDPNGHPRWEPFELRDDGVAWPADPSRPADPAFHLVRVPGQPSRNPGDAWALVATRLPAGRLRVNGEEIPLGLRILRHRDQIRSGQSLPLYFSQEMRASVEAYAASSAPAKAVCARCSKPLRAGQAVVRCPHPSCGAVHHQVSDEDPAKALLCYSYSDFCAACRQPIPAPGADFQWSPNCLDEFENQSHE